MARTDDDSWDLASSVGATATMVAAARAMVTRIDGALISDPYAEPLVRAVGVDVFTKLASGELDPSAFDVDDDQNAGMDRMVDNMAVRTKFFDDFFTDATAAGIRQVVILASGLDSRAYRLQWPAGTVVYEVDQPQVIDVQDAGARRDRRRAHLRPSRGGDRSAFRLARRAEGGGLRRRPADGVECRRPARLSAARRPGPAAGHHHRAERPGQPAGHRERTAHRPEGRRRGDGEDAVGRRPVARTRLRPRLGQPRLPRRPQRARRLPDRARLGGERHQCQRAADRQRVPAVRRRHALHQPALHQRHPAAEQR